MSKENIISAGELRENNKETESQEKKRAKFSSSSTNLRERIVELERELTNKDKLIERISLIVGKLTVELELKKIIR